MIFSARVGGLCDNEFMTIDFFYPTVSRLRPGDRIVVNAGQSATDSAPVTVLATAPLPDGSRHVTIVTPAGEVLDVDATNDTPVTILPPF